jgi:DNA polymerase (family 10)
LKSVEVDILDDGTLDLPDSILEKLDLVLAAVHYGTKLPSEKQTERIIRGLDNKYVNILVHPTGRIIGERDAYEMDIPGIMEAAKERGCYLEINAQPERLDLKDTYAKMAKEMGLKLAISTDAHSTGDLEYMRLGVGQARRGWLERKDVLNTRTWKQLQKLLARA